MESRPWGANPTEVRHGWVRHPRCVGRARAHLRKVMADWGMAAIEDAALVVLSELLTNAVLHARVPSDRLIETCFRREAEGVRITVDDADCRGLETGAPRGEGGRGLDIVTALARCWGVCPRDGVGKSVWALVAAPGEEPEPVRMRVWVQRVQAGDRVAGVGGEREVADVREDRDGGRAEVVLGLQGGGELRLHAGSAVDVVRSVRW
ncbi:ATP-binding protein [Streptomyces sp. URMC 126]|uniref:ATP-binding protein n=1 Tax=Streptomyces sp. URMC 126 TaxID=3423401 RepID=UPI003F1996EB